MRNVGLIVDIFASFGNSSVYINYNTFKDTLFFYRDNIYSLTPNHCEGIFNFINFT